MSDRIYIIKAKRDHAYRPRLVRATSQSQALRHIAADFFEIRVATQTDLVDSLSSGSTVETARVAEVEGAE